MSTRAGLKPLFFAMLLGYASFWAACGNTAAPKAGDKVLAEVYDKKIYFSNLDQELLPDGLSPEDSALTVRAYAQRWAVEQLLMYEAERNGDDEEFVDFARRVGTTRFEDEVRELALPAEFKLDNILEFIDWSRRDPYRVERGEGECAI